MLFSRRRVCSLHLPLQRPVAVYMTGDVRRGNVAIRKKLLISAHFCCCRFRLLSVLYADDMLSFREARERELLSGTLRLSSAAAGAAAERPSRLALSSAGLGSGLSAHPGRLCLQRAAGRPA